MTQINYSYKLYASMCVCVCVCVCVCMHYVLPLFTSSCQQ